jgi:hypothetical protein
MAAIIEREEEKLTLRVPLSPIMKKVGDGFYGLTIRQAGR